MRSFPAIVVLVASVNLDRDVFFGDASDDIVHDLV